MNPADLIDVLRRRGESIAVAESLTGGLVVAELIRVPGASDVVRGGIVSYATDLKASLLGVDQGILDAGGPVQEVVAEQMAAGVARVCGATWGLSTTGVAGPGPSEGHPAGTVYLGLVGPSGRTALQAAGLVDRAAAGAGREEIRVATVRAALTLALDTLTRGV